MNVQDRKDIFKLITTRYPDQPASETIIRWAEELIEPTDYGLALLDAVFPEIIDTDMDSQFSLFIDALVRTLNDHNNTTTLTEEKQAVKDCLTESSLKPLFTV